MKLRTLVIAGLITAIAAPAAGAAKGGSSTDPSSGNTRDSATGGGQAFFDRDDPAGSTGAGDTVAFTAHRAKGAPEGSDAATGQIQVNRRTTGAVKFHGTIDCLVTNGVKGSGAGDAYMSGKARNGEPFELYVSDGGKGQMERNDMIMLYHGTTEVASNDSDPNNQGRNEVCGFSDFNPQDDSFPLYRGNVQVRNRDNSADNEPNPGTPAAARLSVANLF